ncbi:hypothetical protein ACFRJ1_07725 [Streptomyces sp. NPDC056773]|uniref:hypothetical protein n=1 Tax=unclassified Streptomyces TaxID=2593676 RepID=UPI0036AF6D68
MNRGERSAAGRRRSGPASPASAFASRTATRGAVLHLVAHPADVLAVTGPELLRAASEPGPALTVVSLAAQDAHGRRTLLDALGRGSAWHEHDERLAAGDATLRLRIHTLAAGPDVQVCFVDGPVRLLPGAPEDLVDCADALIDRFEPTRLCTLDPDPAHTAYDSAAGAERSDHPEHTAVAQAVLEAVARRADEDRQGPLVVESFRAAGPCDRGEVPPAAVNRYPGRRVWLTRGSDGRLTAYAALDGGVVRWTEKTAGGSEWTRQRLDTPALLPVLSVAQTPEGWVHLVSLSRKPEDSGSAVVEVMHAVQYQTGRPLADWRSLGNPHGRHTDRGRELGVPVAVADAHGGVHVFTRNFSQYLTGRSQKQNGVWGSWADLVGGKVLDGIATVLGDDGRPEVFAATPTGVGRWRRGPDGQLRQARDRLPLIAAEGTPVSALSTGPGLATVYGCDARDGGLYAFRTDGMAASAGGSGRHGATALRAFADGYDCTVLLQRSAEGPTAIGVCVTGHEQSGLWWELSGEQGIGEPAGALDAFGNLVVASLRPDGRLDVARQDASRQGLALGGWMTV